MVRHHPVSVPHPCCEFRLPRSYSRVCKAPCSFPADLPYGKGRLCSTCELFTSKDGSFFAGRTNRNQRRHESRYGILGSAWAEIYLRSAGDAAGTVRFKRGLCGTFLYAPDPIKKNGGAVFCPSHATQDTRVMVLADGSRIPLDRITNLQSNFL